MAQFDLKNATLFVRDGYAKAAAINLASGYPAGALSMAIDGFTGVIAVGDKFMIAGDTTVYTVTAHTETLGDTTSITFTPALAAAAGDNVVITVYQPNADTAMVNNGAGYAAGATVIAIDNFIGAVAVGDKVLIAGDTVIHSVTAHTETLGNTTSITISPALGASVADNAVVTIYQPNVDTALVNNNTGGYAPGATTIAIDGLVGLLATTDVFHIAGDSTNTKYKITAHSETLGNTTSVTFTPPLAAAIADNAVVTVGPHEIEVKLGTGNCTYTEKKKRDYTLDRGRLSTVRDGDEDPVEVKFDAIWEFLRGSSTEPPSVEDAMKKRGQAAGWTSSAADGCEPYSVDLVIEYIPPCGSVGTEIITLPDFRYEDVQHDMKAGTLSFTGKCNVTEAAVVRLAA